MKNDMKRKVLMTFLLEVLVIGETLGTTLAISYSEVPAHLESTSKTAPRHPMIFGDKDQLTVRFREDMAYVYQGKLYLPFEWEWNGLPEFLSGGKDALIISFPWEIHDYPDPHIFYEYLPEVRIETVYGMEYKVGPPSFSIEPTEELLFYNGGYHRVYQMFIKIPVDDDVPWGIIWVGITPKKKITLGTHFGYFHNWDYITSTMTAFNVLISIKYTNPLVSTTVTWSVEKILGDVLGRGRGLWEKKDERDIIYSTSEYPWKTTPPWPPCSPKGICPTYIGGSVNEKG